MSYPVLIPTIGQALAEEIDDELLSSRVHGEKFASLHEAYAVLYEEVDEVWEITKLKKKNRDREKLRRELIQVAAMAIKALHSLDAFVGGKV